ncbi:hypothetical protein ACFQE5_01940, partial [Pseudonocardia hispaniensis]
MPTTGPVYAGAAAAVAQTWTGLGNATGGPDNATATWTSGTRSTTGTVELSGFGLHAVLPPGGDATSVMVTVRSSVSDTFRITSHTAQLYLGGTPVGSPTTLTKQTGLTDQAFVVPGPIPYAQLADLRVRVSGTKGVQTTTTTVAVDAVWVEVSYEQPSTTHEQTGGAAARAAAGGWRLVTGPTGYALSGAAAAAVSAAGAKTVTPAATHGTAGGAASAAAGSGTVVVTAAVTHAQTGGAASAAAG